MSLTLTYDLEGAGWAIAQIQDGVKSVNITVSYLHDTLRKLAEAARVLRDGAETARVVFMNEPGEIQLLLTRTGADLIYELRWFDDWNSWDMHPDERYEVVHRGETTVLQFLSEVLKELEALLDQNGEEGYVAKWQEARFPTELLRNLRQTPRAELDVTNRGTTSG